MGFIFAELVKIFGVPFQAAFELIKLSSLGLLVYVIVDLIIYGTPKVSC